MGRRRKKDTSILKENDYFQPQQLKTHSYPLLFRLSIVSNSPIRLYSNYMMHNLQCVIQFLINGQFKWSKKQQLTPESSSFVSFFMLCTAYLCWGMGIGGLARSSECRNHWQIDFPFCFPPPPLGLATRQHTTRLTAMQLYNSQLFSFHLLCCWFPKIPLLSLRRHLFIYVCWMSPRLMIC